MSHDPQWNDPPLHAKVELAISSFGWMVGALMSAGAVAWVRTLRRVLRGD